MKGSVVTIQSGGGVVGVAPDAGGAITRYARQQGSGSLDIFRPALPGAVANKVPTDMSCFPLVPFSNRIRNGRFTFNGHDVQLTPNFLPEPHAIHGYGWKTAWEVIKQADDSLTIGYSYEGGEWPFPYSATQSFTLSGDELKVALRVQNEGAETMPVGFGIHPFFVRTRQTKLIASVDGEWLSGADSMPTELVPLASDRRLDRGIDPDQVAVDNNFTGWDGIAAVEWADRGLRVVMRAEGPFAFLVVYTPAGKDFLCAEPATNMLDAFNQAKARTDTGTIELEPGEEVSGVVTFSPEDLS